MSSSWQQVHTRPGLVILQESDAWHLYEEPVETLVARAPNDVRALIERAEAAASRGLFAAGFLAYEAAAAFDPAFPRRESGGMPLAWFGIYARREPIEPPTYPALAFRRIPKAGPWTPSVAKDRYAEAIDTIKTLIAAGDTYQVNYTFRLRGPFEGDPLAYFVSLCLGQRARYCAYVDTGDHVICSASPELFFRLDGESVVCRPMKGTASRGTTWDDDQKRAASLHRSAKNRAENVMIVDMVRNDLGRVANTGSVDVRNLFEVERYPTVFQLTSSVEARTTSPVRQLFDALFPCASVTGAPKVRTMQIIRDLESEPRGIYTGAIGVIGPNRKAQFNVAIRTACIDRTTSQVEYGTGGGIIWDSLATQEYDECYAKALVLQADPKPFQLLETLRWSPLSGYFLRDLHLDRLAESALYFDFNIDLRGVAERLDLEALGFPRGRQRVRLLVGADGTVTVEAQAIGPSSPIGRITLDAEPVSSDNPFLYHKTSRREVYDAARRRHPDADDVILWNERGEVTESTICNVVARFGRELVTPPVSCGLLPGTFRARLLARDRIRERVILKDDLARADAVYLVNSVRGWTRCLIKQEDR